MLSREEPLLQIPQVPVADIELPDDLGGLFDIAYNFRWTWRPEVHSLFDRIDTPAWERYRNPVQFLISVPPTHWQRFLESDSFHGAYHDAVTDLQNYMDRTGESWFWRRYPDYEGGPVAYFSMEYGLHASLPIYSGGLGILSGDHCKSASDLGVPMIAVGLAYGHGYFRQTIDFEGIQQHFYPRYDFARLGMRPVAGKNGKELRVTVPVYDRNIHVRAWVAQIGRVPVLLLDTDVPENGQSDRPITQTLYVRGREMRLIQEIVLGIGGARMLEALGIQAESWHLNEGHVSLLQIERLDKLLNGKNGDRASDFDRAIGRIAADSLFTNHTPVPAGNEVYDPNVARTFLAPFAAKLEVDVDRLIDLGDAKREDPGFNLTAFGMRTSTRSNGVSVLNSEVTNGMWGHLDLPGPRPQDKPILPVTNGVHVTTWIGNSVRRLFERHIDENWDERLLEPEIWQKLNDLPDDELWQARLAQKRRLAHFCRSRWMRQFARHGQAPSELRDVAGLLDPDALVIGFARRFATYKRAG
ncbi:MAG: alpha-glucan family phosphorylase, partial [Acidobacteriota bacterium]